MALARQRQRHRASNPLRRRVRNNNRNIALHPVSNSENDIVDLTCTADEEIYDLTNVIESPLNHTPIVISDTPTRNWATRHATDRNGATYVPPRLELAENETEDELPSYLPLPVPDPLNSASKENKPSSEQNITCPICMDTLTQIHARQSHVVSTTCGHIFCAQCIDDILKAKPCQCPSCRKKLVKKDVHRLFI